MGDSDEQINGDTGATEDMVDESHPMGKGNEEKKIFVGGISYDTTNEDLQSYFGQFGEVSNAQVKYDQSTGRSRGFAFIEFGSVEACRESLKARNQEIKGKKVEVKPAKSRENKKVFVGGLPSDFSEDDLRNHFQQFGPVEDVEWPFDKQRNVKRNFAFVVFEEEGSADAASREQKQKFGDRMCDVKKAVPQPKRFQGAQGFGFGMGGMRGGYGGRGRGRGGQWGGGNNWYGQGGWGGDWYGGAGGYAGAYGAGYGGGYGGGYGATGYGGGYYGDGDYSSNNYEGYWSGWGGAQSGQYAGGTS